MRDDLDGEDGEALPMDDAAQALVDSVDDDNEVIVDRAVAPEAAGKTDAPTGPARDEHGRFAPAAAPEPAGEAAKPAGAPAGGPATFQQMKEFLDANEARQRAERERDEFKARVERIEAAERAKQQAPVDDPNLMFTNPVAYRQQVMDAVRQQMADQRLDMLHEVATMQFGPALAEAKAAIAALPRAQGQAIADALGQAPNPFAAAVAWHRREKTMAAIPDGDLTKYEAGLRDRLLKDPAFLAQAVETARGQAAGGPAPGGAPAPNGRPGSNVHRLPSLGRAGSAAIAALPDDLSDRDLLDSITAGR